MAIVVVAKEAEIAGIVPRIEILMAISFMIFIANYLLLTHLIPNARAILDARNRIIHANDNDQREFLCGLVIGHIPELKKDIERILA